MKLVLPSLLLVSLLALGGLGVAATRFDSTTSGLSVNASTVAQTKEATQAVQAKSGTTANTRPYLGIEYMQITPQTASYYNLSRQSGTYVNSVAANSPAAKAGIQANSIITRFDGTTLDQNNTLVELLLKHKIGDSVKLTVVPPNSNTEKEVTAVLGTRPSNP